MFLEQEKIYDLFAFIQKNKLENNILKAMLPVYTQNKNQDFNTVLKNTGYQNLSQAEILSRISTLKTKYQQLTPTPNPAGESDWIMGQLRPLALGNMDLRQLRKTIEGGRS